MKTVVVKLEHNSAAKLLVKFFKQTGIEAKVVNDEAIEDFLLGKLMEEAEKEGGEISEKEVAKYFKKHGAKI